MLRKEHAFYGTPLSGCHMTGQVDLCQLKADDMFNQDSNASTFGMADRWSAFSGTMAAEAGRGYPLRPPRAWTTALVSFGLLQLYLFVINESLVPEGIRVVLYAIVKDKASAQALAGLVTLVHVGEGLVALVTCLRRRYALVPTLYYSTLSFLLGFPGLGLTLKLDKINRNRATAKED